MNAPIESRALYITKRDNTSAQQHSLRDRSKILLSSLSLASEIKTFRRVSGEASDVLSRLGWDLRLRLSLLCCWARLVSLRLRLRLRLRPTRLRVMSSRA